MLSLEGPTFKEKTLFLILIISKLIMQALLLLVFIVCYGFAKCIREITRERVMCHYLTTHELIYD